MEIESTTFGTITINGKTYEHDVVTPAAMAGITRSVLWIGRSNSACSEVRRKARGSPRAAKKIQQTIGLILNVQKLDGRRILIYDPNIRCATP